MRVPASTYRLQLSADFTLQDAAGRLPGLHDLGVDWVYLSPILQAAHGSTHGYDVVDHDRIDDARGGADGLAALSQHAHRLGMGVLVDIVPNHMGVAVPAENRAWWDVLERGRGSPYAAWFDIDWTAAERLRIPVVGDQDLLADGELANLAVVGEELHYHDNRYPIAPGTAHPDPQVTHSRQHYELIGWRRADRELGYRRFFGINTLAGLRVEHKEVFDATHREIGRWFTEGLIDGLRVDHPDGLRDPAEYLARLRELTGGAYLLVEKILEPGEELSRWECEGTTGYDSLALIDRVLTDPAGEEPLGRTAERIACGSLDWHRMTHRTKRDIADGMLASEVQRLVRELRALAGDSAPTPDAMADALAELLACFPVYRSYLPVGAQYLTQAADAARSHRPDLGATLDWIVGILADAGAAPAARFQQTSGMVMAKGVEDTAFYRYSRLTSLNEVGGDPSIFSIPSEEFHQAMIDRQRDWPHTMNALTTHDTKRGEDTRARITALAEYPDEWAQALASFADLVPDRDGSLGNLVNQAVIGSWPAAVDRLTEYAVKAAREAGTVTTWTENDERYEGEIRRYIEDLESEPTGRHLERLVAALEPSRRVNVLGAKLLNLMLPGVPDVYQGSEAIEASLVDPDNRRPVPWETLDTLRKRVQRPVAANDSVEVCKARIVREALRARRDRPSMFTSYTPVRATGDAAEHLLGFDRGGAIALVTRLPRSLAARGGWAGTRIDLPTGVWRDLLTEEVVCGGDRRAADLLAKLPVALLVRQDSDA